MKFNSNKRLLVIAVSLPCALSMVGCMTSVSARDDVNTQITGTSSTIVQSELDTSDTTEISETSAKPSSFDDYVDETLPNNRISEKSYDITEFRKASIWFSSVGIGYGNPRLLKCVKEFFSNDSLGTEDIPYYSSPGSEYEVELNGFVNSEDFDYVRYVLEENNLRMWIDEIPYEFFEEKFPDYVKICNQDKFFDLDDQYGDYFWTNGMSHGYNGSLALMQYDSNNIDKMKLATFIQLAHYNRTREAIATNISDNDDKTTKYGYIETGVTRDGKYVWCPTKLQYRVVQNDVKRLPKCENVDILIPETREDLIASGIDVEKYDEMCEELFGGAKMKKNKTQDDQSRSRG